MQKLLARQGVGSRREIEGWIAAGRLSVEGRPVVLGEKLRPGQGLLLDGKPLLLAVPRAQAQVLMLHKPAGTVCTRRDPEGRPTVFELLPRGLQRQLICVGRLDFNTSGLLLFTTDGELAHRLMHPRHAVPREYAVRIFGGTGVTDEMLVRLQSGVEVDGESLSFDSVERQPGQGANEWFLCRLHTGRNREVRRLWEALGLTVSRLIRTRFGPLALPRRLPAGRHAEVSEAERNALYAAVDLDPPAGEARTAVAATPRRRRVDPRSGRR